MRTLHQHSCFTDPGSKITPPLHFDFVMRLLVESSSLHREPWLLVPCYTTTWNLSLIATRLSPWFLLLLYFRGQAFPLISQHSRRLAACPPWHTFARWFRCTAPNSNRSSLLERVVLLAHAHRFMAPGRANCKQNQSSLVCVRVKVQNSKVNVYLYEEPLLHNFGLVCGGLQKELWNFISFYSILFWEITVFIAHVEVLMSLGVMLAEIVYVYVCVLCPQA